MVTRTSAKRKTADTDVSGAPPKPPATKKARPNNENHPPSGTSLRASGTGRGRRERGADDVNISRDLRGTQPPADEHSSTDLLQRFKNMEAEFRKQKEALEKQKADNAALQEKINEASMATNKDPGAPKVPKPKGTAGTDYSIQIEMGLSGTTKKKAKYLSIMRVLRDLTLAARLDWEKPWAEISMRQRADLLDVAKEQIPFLDRFVNQWATVDLVTQYMKNKRGRLYKLGEIDVPEKFNYLKANASKRDPNGSRKKRACVSSAGTSQGSTSGRSTRKDLQPGKHASAKVVPLSDEYDTDNLDDVDEGGQPSEDDGEDEDP